METAAEKEARLLQEDEEEVRKLEEKRKILENYYKSKAGVNILYPGITPSSASGRGGGETWIMLGVSASVLAGF